MRRQLCAIAGIVAIAGGAAGCGSSADRGTATGSSTLTIYSSLPLQGPSRLQSLSIINGEKLALEQAGGIVGKYTVKYVSLDDAKSSTGGWDPGVALTNARSAVQDKSTIAYLGDFDSGASAVSIPLLNAAAILQISPSNSSVGLTQVAGKGEPEKYYPSGRRTYGRVVPSDKVQAAAQVDLQREEGCRSTYLADDGHIDGEAIAHRVEAAADLAGLTVVGGDEVDPAGDSYAKLAEKLGRSGADCMFFGGSTPATSATLFDQLHASMPDIKFFGSALLAVPEFASALDPGTQAVTHVTSPALTPRLYPAAGQKFFRDYKQMYDAQPEPYAIYGYTAMKIALTAIAGAGAKGNDRQAVTSAFFRIRDHPSAIGPFSVDRFGDTSINHYGSYRIAGGKLVFDRIFKAT